MSKIKTVKFHTNIHILGSYHSFLTPEEYRSAKGTQPPYTLSESEHGITIETADEIIKVGWSNIVCLKLEKVEPKKVTKP